LDKLREVKLNYAIRSEANEYITINLRSQPCFAYNPKLKAYVGCQLADAFVAGSLATATAELRNECDRAGLSPAECRQQREADLPRNPVSGNASTERINDRFEQFS